MAKKLWKCRVEVEFVTIGETAEDVRESCPGYLREEVSTVSWDAEDFSITPITDLLNLPPGWDERCIPYGQRKEHVAGTVLRYKQIKEIFSDNEQEQPCTSQ